MTLPLVLLREIPALRRQDGGMLERSDKETAGANLSESRHPASDGQEGLGLFHFGAFNVRYTVALGRFTSRRMVSPGL